MSVPGAGPDPARLLSLQERGLQRWKIHLFEDLIALCYRSLVRPGDLVVDAGAHVGMHTIPLAARVGPGGRVVAIEPLPSIFRILKARCEALSLGQVELHAVAVGAQEGSCDLHSLPDQPAISSLAPGHVTGWMSRSGPRAVKAEDLDRTRVEVRTLDAILGARSRSWRFGKLDLEGGEFDALRGARGALETGRPTLVLEFDYFHSARNFGYDQEAWDDLWERLDYRIRDLAGRDLTRIPWGEVSHPLCNLIAAPRGSADDSFLGAELAHLWEGHLRAFEAALESDHERPPDLALHFQGEPEPGGRHPQAHPAGVVPPGGSRGPSGAPVPGSAPAVPAPDPAPGRWGRDFDQEIFAYLREVARRGTHIDELLRRVTSLESDLRTRDATIETLKKDRLPPTPAPSPPLPVAPPDPPGLLTRARRRASRLLARLDPWMTKREARRTIEAAGRFDPAHYRAQAGGAIRSTDDPIDHFLTRGSAGGLAPEPGFDPRFYVESNPDVRRSGLDPYVHWLRHGRAEGRPGVRPPPSAQGRGDPVSGSPSTGPVSVEAREEAPKILFVDHRLPDSTRDAGSSRLLEIIAAVRDLGLATAIATCLEPEYDPSSPAAEAALRQRGVRVLRGRKAALEMLRSQGASLRYVWLSRPGVAESFVAPARALAIFAKVVYDTVDLHWIRTARAEGLGVPTGKSTSSEQFKAQETWLARSADVTIVTSPAEHRILASACPPGVRIEVIPVIYPVREAPGSASPRRGALFLGSREHLPNVDALDWYMREVFPLIASKDPTTSLTIVGSGMEDLRTREWDARVRIEGWVPDLGPLFDRSKMLVAPLRIGAGIKGKIVHAMSQGLPVVTTPVGAEGLDLEDGRHALVADSAAGLAEAVLRLEGDQDLWDRMAREGLELVRGRFSPGVARTTLERLLCVSGDGQDSALPPRAAP